ncbi:MAG: DUF58 domain-containing protein [Planctomycetota bacterium]
MIDPEILAQVKRIQVRTNRLVTDVMSGGYTSVFRGTGIEFDEVREYVEGDDPRMVDWNVTARTGRPYVKKYMEERELTVLFLLDVSASTGFGTTPDQRGGVRTVRETAAEFCACIALAAQRNNDKTGLIAFSDRTELYVPAKKGSFHVLRLIRDVLALEAGGSGSDLRAALDYAGRVQRKRAIVFVISDFLVDDFQQALSLVARRHDVVAVRIMDPKTQELPRAGLLHLRDLETGRAAWVDTGSRRVRQAYAAAMKRQEAQLLDSFKRAHVDHMKVWPHRSVADPIVRFFQMRELRGAHR